MQYEIKLKGDPEEKLKQARKIAAERGVKFVGDGTRGKFSERITGREVLIGSYTVNGGILLVTITEKPFLTSWNMIESQLKEFLRS